MLSFARNHSEVLEGAFCCKDTEADSRPGRDCVETAETHFLVERYSRIRGKNPVIHKCSHMNETSPQSFQLSLLPCLVFWFHSGDLLLNLVAAKRSYRESYKRVFMVDNIVR